MASSPKALYRVNGRHNDFMFVDHPVFVEMCDHIEPFVVEAFESSVNASPLTVG